MSVGGKDLNPKANKAHCLERGEAEKTQPLVPCGVRLAEDTRVLDMCVRTNVSVRFHMHTHIDLSVYQGQTFKLI